MKKINNNIFLFAVASLLLFHGRAEAFFGINISNEDLYTLGAIALLVVLLVVAFLVFGIRKLIRICRAQNSLRPAWLTITVIIVAGVTAAYFHDIARKSAQEYKRNYYEQAGKIIPDNKPTDQISTIALPQLPPQPIKFVIEDSVEATEITGRKRMPEPSDADSQ